MDILCIYHLFVGHLHIHGIYQAYSRHIPKIQVPDDALQTCTLDSMASVCALHLKAMVCLMPVGAGAILVQDEGLSQGQAH
jgi:hypothetical protein